MLRRKIRNTKFPWICYLSMSSFTGCVWQRVKTGSIVKWLNMMSSSVGDWCNTRVLTVSVMVTYRDLFHSAAFHDASWWTKRCENCPEFTCRPAWSRIGRFRDYGKVRIPRRRTIAKMNMMLRPWSKNVWINMIIGILGSTGSWDSLKMIRPLLFTIQFEVLSRFRWQHQRRRSVVTYPTEQRVSWRMTTDGDWTWDAKSAPGGVFVDERRCDCWKMPERTGDCKNGHVTSGFENVEGKPTTGISGLMKD